MAARAIWSTKEDAWPPGHGAGGGGGRRPWGSHGSAVGSASQKGIVLDAPLLSFPRRQAGGNWRGTGYPEISLFMSFLV